MTYSKFPIYVHNAVQQLIHEWMIVGFYENNLIQALPFWRMSSVTLDSTHSNTYKCAVHVEVSMHTFSKRCLLRSRDFRHTGLWSPPWQITLMVIRLSVCIHSNGLEFCTSQFPQFVFMWHLFFIQIVSFPASNCQGTKFKRPWVK